MSEQLNRSLPHHENQLLLHSCCAPCSGEIITALLHLEIELTVFFYNPNIHPRQEYELRKAENKRFANQHQIPFVDGDYDPDYWFSRTKGMEFDAERGPRCQECFDIRLERTALYAHDHGFKVFTSSVGMSRWKDFNQVNECGIRAAQHYPNLTYWTYNWRKQGGSQRMIAIAKREHFYQQEYCGCVHSLREVNQKRKTQGRNLVKIGVEYYSGSDE
jgi:predicted adenine nucleotide alpha hydrolase (AANH) superfamily ATPase